MTNMSRSLLATDLDGTLLRSDGTVSDRSREQIANAAGSGLGLVFVTGRPVHFLEGIADTTGHRGVALCANGAMVTSLATLEPILVRTMAPEDTTQIAHTLADLDPHAEMRVMLHREGQAPLRVVEKGGHAARVLTEILTDGWQAYKMAVISARQGHTSDAFLDEVLPHIGHLGEITHSSPAYPLIEIGPRGVHKGSALEQYAADLGLTAEHVHAVGDMPNDLPMLSWAGTSYAVANAHPQVREATHRTLPSNDDDGVAQLLAELLNQP
jgi:Cof subfamily protein (haloacid dehalogenase superfamily)